MGSRTRRAVLGLPPAALGVCGYAGGLGALCTGAGRVMRAGGYCASGGPYAISHPCPAGTGGLIGGGIGAALLSALVLVFAVSYLGGPAIESALVLWIGAFAALAAVSFANGAGAGESIAGFSFVFLAVLGAVPLVSAIGDALRGPRLPPPSELVLGEVVRAVGRRPPPS